MSQKYPLRIGITLTELQAVALSEFAMCRYKSPKGMPQALRTATAMIGRELVWARAIHAGEPTGRVLRREPLPQHQIKTFDRAPEPIMSQVISEWVVMPPGAAAIKVRVKGWKT